MGVCKSKNSQQQPELVIKTVTWQRDSHGLFDYEGKDQDKKQLKAVGSFSLMRHEVNVEVKYDDEEDKLEESKEEETLKQQIAKVIEKNGSYWIYHSSTYEDEEEEIEKNPEQKLWKIVKFCKQQNGNAPGYRLQPDDLIKLGRVRFKIREIQSPAYRKQQQRLASKQKKFNNQQTRVSQRQLKKRNTNEMTETDNYHIDAGISENEANFIQQNANSKIITPKATEPAIVVRDPSLSSNGAPLCRICLSEENDQGNPLFSPCKCAGTMKYIHLNCLQEWLNSRKVTKETLITKTFYWKNLECELCKTTFPNFVKMNDNRQLSLRVIQYETPVYQPGEEPNYIVFESISTNTSKVIHVVNLIGEQEIKLGRGHDAHVRVTDISVSRLHAVIKKSSKGYFVLEDNHSKFGTLALVRSPILLQMNDSTFVQAGRSMVEISIRRPIKLMDSCFCTPSTNNNATNRRSSMVKTSGGLTTKNGVDYFPEEFLSDKRKIKKANDLKIRLEKHLNTVFQSEGIDEFGQLPQQQNQRISIVSNDDYQDDQQNHGGHEERYEEHKEEQQFQSSINNNDFQDLGPQQTQQFQLRQQIQRAQSYVPNEGGSNSGRETQLRKSKTRKSQKDQNKKRKNRNSQSQNRNNNNQQKICNTPSNQAQLEELQTQRNIEELNPNQFQNMQYGSIEDIPLSDEQHRQYYLQNANLYQENLMQDIPSYRQNEVIVEEQKDIDDVKVFKNIRSEYENEDSHPLQQQNQSSDYIFSTVRSPLDQNPILGGQLFIKKHKFNDEAINHQDYEVDDFENQGVDKEATSLVYIKGLNKLTDSNLPTERDRKIEFNKMKRQLRAADSSKHNPSQPSKNRFIEDKTFIEEDKREETRGNQNIPDHDILISEQLISSRRMFYQEDQYQQDSIHEILETQERKKPYKQGPKSPHDNIKELDQFSETFELRALNVVKSPRYLNEYDSQQTNNILKEENFSNQLNQQNIQQTKNLNRSEDFLNMSSNQSQKVNQFSKVSSMIVNNKTISQNYAQKLQNEDAFYNSLSNFNLVEKDKDDNPNNL